MLLTELSPDFVRKVLIQEVCEYLVFLLQGLDQQEFLFLFSHMSE